MRFAAEPFAVEDGRAQLVWRGAPAGPIDVEVTGPLDREPTARRAVGAYSESSTGSLFIDELEPGAAYAFTARAKRTGAEARGEFRTLERPVGAELFRWATMSDIHIGERLFGRFPRIPTDPLGSAKAAINAWTDWGADEVVIKGDAVDHGTHEQWQSFESLFRSIPQPAHLMLGNHETMKKSRVDPRAMLQAMKLPTDPVRALDRPGLRVVLVETAIDDRGYGRIHAASDALDAVAQADRPCLVILHHYVQRRPWPTFWPPGIGSVQGNAFMRALGRANPRVLVTAGHSHRNRRRSIHGVDHVEVGSVKDFPGVWAGYAVYEGGLQQTSFRVDEPDCLAITDGTRRVMMGAWRIYAPGSIGDRCFTRHWAA